MITLRFSKYVKITLNFSKHVWGLIVTEIRSLITELLNKTPSQSSFSLKVQNHF